MHQHSDSDRPVPQPRRNLHAGSSLHAKPASTAYENVQIELLNKCTALNNDNLLQHHNDTNKSPRSKVPNNKAFLLLPTGNDYNPDAQPTDTTDDANGNLMPSSSAVMSPNTRRIIITEMNDLNLDQPASHYDKNCANKNFEESHKMHNLPVPAPRRLAVAAPLTAQQQTDEEIYESNEDTVQQLPSPASAVTSTSSSSSASPVPGIKTVPTWTPQCDHRTGAISKTPRSVPLPPPKSPKSPKCIQIGTGNNHNSGGGSAVSTASGVLVDGGVGMDDDLSTDLRRNRKLNKSNVSLSSSTSGGSGSPASADTSARYAKGSPSTLLKALGEAIGERVTERTKGAVHKMDKMQQNSIDKLHGSTQRLLNAGNRLHQSSLDRLHDTKRSLKNVRQAIGMKLIGGNHDEFSPDVTSASNANKSKANNISHGSYDFERPQTVPADDEMFQSLSFDSPLRTATKTTNVHAAMADGESSYEVPPQLARKCSLSESEAPPSYTDLYRTGAEKDALPSELSLFRRNSAVTQSLHGALGTGCRQTMELPCPAFPAPVFQTPATTETDDNYGRIRTAPRATVTDSMYTEMNPVRPQLTSRRRDDYEETQIRFKPMALDCSSTRATIDSTDDCLRRATVDSERSTVPSVDLSRAAVAAEHQVPRPGRSDSWTFYDATTIQNDDDDNDDDDDDDDAGGSSTPEPIYANEEQPKVLSTDDRWPIAAEVAVAAATVTSEPLYGVVYGSEATQQMPTQRAPPTILVPTTVPRTKRAMAAVNVASKCESTLMATGAGGGSHEIIREFDPLVMSAIDQICASESNELMLLENLLGEETYGRTTTVSTAASTEDGAQTDDDDDDAQPGVIPPMRTDSLATAEPAIETRVSALIVHQNLSLHAIQLPNEDELVAPFLARVEKNENRGDGGATRTNWFVDDMPTVGYAAEQPKLQNKTAKAPVDTAVKNFKHFDPPPAYSADGTTEAAAAAAVSVPKSPSAQKTSMRSMLSNVFNLKRKSSFAATSRTAITPAAGTASTTTTSGDGSIPSSVTDSSSYPALIEMCPRPALTQRLSQHDGIVIRLPSKPTDDILREQYKAAAFVRERRFQAYTDREMRTAKENIALEHIASVQCVSQHKFTDHSLELHCFEITTLQPKGDELTMASTSGSGGLACKYTRTAHLYGVAKESERDIWMQRLLEAMCDVLPPAATCRFYRAGWCYMKPSITGRWSGAWLLLQKHKKRLVVYSMAGMNVEWLDLRKARCLILKDPEPEELRALHVERGGPLLMVDCPPHALYMTMGTARETKIWRHIIMEVAHNNGPALKEQQLTKDDVAVLVDKCVNFVYAHGSMSEGIYRKSGSEQAIQRLLQLFRADAFSVQITRAEYTEHDVANAIKRFMRDLPERLLGRSAASFVAVAAAEMPAGAAKITAYTELLERLPAIERQTLRKLLGHLNFIASQAVRNKMSVENLAIVWGPTLLENKQQRQSDNMGFSQAEANVVVDLISHYKQLYKPSADEVAKELIMLNVLQKYHAAAENLSDTVKQSGDLKVWITIDAGPTHTDAATVIGQPAVAVDKSDRKKSKKNATSATDTSTNERPQVNVTLTPTKTAHDVCKELAHRFSGQHIEPTALSLYEYILDGDLHRPLHHTERPFDVVLRWSYWPEADRKHNTLRVQPLGLMGAVARVLRMAPIVPLPLTPLANRGELRYADQRTRTLRPFVLELADGRLTVMRRERGGNCVVPVRDVEVRSVTAYVGAERKRTVQQRWAITLVERDVGGKCSVLRTRDAPYFGHVIAGTDTQDQLVWYASIMHSLYGENILPDAEIILT